MSATWSDCPIPSDVRKRFVLGLWAAMSEAERQQIIRRASARQRDRTTKRWTDYKRQRESNASVARALLAAVRYWQADNGAAP